MKLKAFFSLLLLLAASAKLPAEALTNERLEAAIVLIAVESPNSVTDHKTEVATGFFIEFPTKGPQPALFLVTARHALERADYLCQPPNPASRVWVQVSKPHADATFVVFPAMKDGRNLWVHGGDDIDVAVLPIDRTLLTGYQINALQVQDIATDAEIHQDIHLGASVATAGTFSGLIAKAQKNVVFRFGSLAYLPGPSDVCGRTEQLWYADMQIYPSNSGSPVITVQGSGGASRLRPKLIGIIARGRPDDRLAGIAPLGDLLGLMREANRAIVTQGRSGISR